MTPAQYLRWLAIHSTQPTAVRLLAKTITVEEWNSKCVYKATLAAIKSKSRSPKLSKVLAALGCQQQHLDLILSATPKTANTSQQSYITQDREYILDQGNTVHYSSCQATKHDTAHGISDIARPEEDIRDDLWLWVIGKPFFEDSQGFICRAKLRLLTDTDGDVRGLYIERIYGSTAALMSEIETLHKWWALYCTQRDMPVYPVYREAEYHADNIVRLYCKSAGYGYQDTLYNDSSREQCFVPVLNGKSIMYQAYCSRIKSAGVYDVPITAVTHNPQNGSYTTPISATKRWRGILWDYVHKTVAAAISVLGNPDPKTMVVYKYNALCKAEWQGREFHVALSLNETGYDVLEDGVELLSYHFNRLVVREDIPELEFYKAENIDRS